MIKNKKNLFMFFQHNEKIYKKKNQYFCAFEITVQEVY